MLFTGTCLKNASLLTMTRHRTFTVLDVLGSGLWRKGGSVQVTTRSYVTVHTMICEERKTVKEILSSCSKPHGPFMMQPECDIAKTKLCEAQFANTGCSSNVNAAMNP